MIKPTKKTLLGYCTVDSGQVMITDPCYLGDWKDNEAFFHPKKDYSYAGASNATEGSKLGGQLKAQNSEIRAVSASSGLGDGTYPVYAEYEQNEKDGKTIRSLTIEFL